MGAEPPRLLLGDGLGRRWGPTCGLRHESTSAALICCGFLHRRIFWAARQLPWSLCTSCVDTNLEELSRRPVPPTDDTARKIWQLTQVKFPREHLVRAVRLLKSCPWSIGLAEQMHGQMAAVRKLHSGYSRRVLTARSFVCLLRPMVSLPDYERKRGEINKKGWSPPGARSPSA